MDSDWDLHAVVRSCSSAGTTTAPPLDPHGQRKSTDNTNNNNNLMDSFFFFTDLFLPRNDNSIEGFLNDLYNPLRFQKLQNTPPSSPTMPISPLGGLQDPSYPHHHHQKQSFGISRCTTSHAQSTTKFKKRKNQTKRVCQVPAAEGSSSDLWSWRKYGQKPIKGSPYPRGYYKCSTSKGCMARKQVERNRSDPGMLIVTYTGEHNHPMPTQRSSLAGNPRSKPTTSGSGEDVTVSPATTLSPPTENMEENEREATDDDNFAVSDIVLEEDFFDGLEELVAGDSLSDHLPPSTAALPFPWLSNNVAATTTTVAGGS